MYKYLFFDDQKFLRRKNFKREIAKPKLLADSIYSDGISSTDLRTPFIFKTDDGKYRMIYQGKVGEKDYCFIAVGDDGVHFEPEDVSYKIKLENRVAKHEVFQIASGEIAEVIEDPYNDPQERYKMLYCDIDGENLAVHGFIYTSPDLLHWKKIEGVEWNGGAEPITGVFYNKQKECFTIMVRPDWGVRKVGYVDTKDWRTFTSYDMSIHCDSLDGPLSEIYGMPSMAYGDYYIGFPLIYRNFSDEARAKFHDGTIDAELAYSFDGHHWQRTLREPFITGLDEQNEKIFGYKNYLMWPSCYLTQENGDTLVFCAASKNEHGVAFSNPGFGKICAFKVRKDRFIAFTTEKKNEESVLTTRENIWNSGEIHINLSCEKATVAIYETKDYDMLATACAIEGYSHEDCVEFSGDSTDWVPVFKNGRTVDELKGKVLIIEVKLCNGSIYSIEGNCIPSMNIQSTRYRKFGTTPNII